MKKVFQTSEVAHIWATQSQPEGRNQTTTVFFDGNTIFSYGRHFPMAHIWDNNSEIVFINSSSYSVTTSGHQSNVRYAVNHKTAFHVPECVINGKGWKHNHIKNINHYLERIETYIGVQKRARKYNYMPEINKWLSELQDYCKMFPVLSLLSKYERELLEIDSAEDLFRDCNFTDLREKREKAETTKAARLQQKRLNEWLGLKVKYVKGKVYLRYNKTTDEIETSHNASVPAREAKILFDRIEAGKDIKGFKIGYFTVISINGTLKIGCHQITRTEIKRFANLMNWK